MKRLKKRKVLFLYTELAGYVLACFDALLEEEVEVSVVHWPINPEAPFKFHYDERIQWYEKSQYPAQKLASLVQEINPDIIYTSGWIDKDYVKVARSYVKKIPVVVGFDNRWFGNPKQQLATLLSPFLVRRNFNRAWVPGELQAVYARKLGFKPSQIYTGFYSADVEMFRKTFDRIFPSKEKKFPHRFIYTGRYMSFKGITDLWEAFIELHRETDTDWELWCVGTGDLVDQAPEHPAIKHCGFVQPEKLPEIMEQTGVFILPSHFEPWGVVMHEFAAAGFPILCSDQIGAAEQFLEPGKNGYSFPASNVEKIKLAMKSMIEKSEEELLEMGRESHRMADRISPKTWAKTLMSIE